MNNTSSSGLISDTRPLYEKYNDYIAGTIQTDERVKSTWEEYLPQGESQALIGKFDTLSCVTFSALHCVEAQIIWMLKNNKLSKFTVEWLTENNYFSDPSDYSTFKLSKRFNAIMSGTTKDGNYFYKVWDSIRHDGCLPDRDLPFGGETWEEYHDPKNITRNMLAKAHQFLIHFKIQYENLAGFDKEGGFNQVELSVCKEHLKSAPLHVGIPTPVAGHAILQGDIAQYDYLALDQYIPFKRRNSATTVPVAFAYKGYVTSLIPYVEPPKNKWEMVERIIKLFKK